jgi:hypothetical protein
VTTTRPATDPDTATPVSSTTAGPTNSEIDTQLARRRAKYLTDLLWHVGAFLIINAAFWAMDLFLGQDGLQWAYWITIFWGIGLAFHVLAWLIDGRQLERRRTERYLEAAQRRSG